MLVKLISVLLCLDDNQEDLTELDLKFMYLKELTKSQGIPYRAVKLLFSGAPAAGKSSLCRRLTGQPPSNMSSSTGVANAALPMFVCMGEESEPRPVSRLIQSSASVHVRGRKSSARVWRKFSLDEEIVSLEMHMSRIGEEDTCSEDSQYISDDDMFVEEAQNEPEVHSSSHFQVPNSIPVTTSKSYTSKIRSESSILSPVTNTLPVERYAKTHSGRPVKSQSVREHSTLSSGAHAQSLTENIEPRPSKQIRLDPSEVSNEVQQHSNDMAAVLQFQKMLRAIHPKLTDVFRQAQNKLKQISAAVYMFDTGGQPEFSEMLPALLPGPAINLVVFDLRKRLRDRYEIQYRSEDKYSEPYRTSLTHEEVIFRSLATVSCLKARSTHVADLCEFDKDLVVDASKPAALLVGTHKDCVAAQTVEETGSLLTKQIKASKALFSSNLVQFYNAKQVLFTVDNSDSENKKQFDDIRDTLNTVIETNFQPVKIPLSWLMFSFRLRKRNQQVYKLENCFKIAQECGICSKSSMKAALWFLHHRVGILLHYPMVPELKDVVFTNLQVLFDRITHLITSCFTFNDLKNAYAVDQFRSFGLFSSADLAKVADKKTVLHFTRIVALLKHLHIVAELEKDENDATIYFMPCALKPTNVESQYRSTSSNTHPPAMLIWFECGFPPVGLFCCLIVKLLNNKSNSFKKWQYARDFQQHRNKMRFRVGELGDVVTLIAHPTYLEVWFDRQCDVPGPSVADVCDNVKCALDTALQEVCESLHYDTHHFFGFFCSNPLCERDCHPAICENLSIKVMVCVRNHCPYEVHDDCCIWLKVSHTVQFEHSLCHVYEKHCTIHYRNLPLELKEEYALAPAVSDSVMYCSSQNFYRKKFGAYK